jgi:hypothetical protein
MKTIVPRLSPSGRLIPRLNIVDEFLGGTSAVLTAASSNANIGECNWNLAATGGGGEVRFRPSTREMAGWYQVEANAGEIVGPYLGMTPSSSAGLVLGTLSYYQWRGVFNGPLSSVFDGFGRFGLGADSGVTSLGSDAVFFEFDAADSDGLIRTVTRAGGVSTTITTEVPWVQGDVYDLRAHRVSDTRYLFFINGSEVSEHDGDAGDHIPDPETLLAPMCQSEAGASNFQIAMDRFELELT